MPTLLKQLAHLGAAGIKRTQVGQAIGKLAELILVQPAGHLFAIAGDEWDCVALVKQPDRPRDLVEGELAGHLVPSPDGSWRYRYSQAAVVAAYGALASGPPAYDSVRTPTLLVLGERSYVPYDHLLDAHLAALGDLLEVVRVPGGHTVLWDALAETSAAIDRFLGTHAQA